MTKHMDKDTRSRKYQFTVNNYPKNLKRFHALAESLEKHHYICYGLETATTGTPHIQGYVELNQAQRFTFLHNYFGFKRNGKILKFHIEIANGTAEENKKYCQKDGDFYEFGEPQTQGSRTDLKQIKEAVSISPKDITPIVHDMVQNNQQLKYAENLRPYYLSHRDSSTPPKVFWIFGRTGIGKTSLVHRTFPDICSVSSYDWLGTGYSQNECLLFDDFREFNLSFEQIIKIIDPFQYTLFYKGGSIPLNSPYIVFTSPYSIDQTFRNTKENLEQLRRRIIEIDLDLEDASSLDLRNYSPQA